MKHNTRRIQPIQEFGAELLAVEKPSRYLGGEALASIKEGDDYFNIALCFPDLYEIGMSNNAIRILYSGLNAKKNLRAERVFAPAPDFEALLQRKNLPLFTLESGLALADVDLLGLALGYELAATSILTVLNSGGIPILASQRGDEDPLVIAGGPASTNPHPYALFLDAAYIGEAEEGFFELCEDLAQLKKDGAGRGKLLERLAGESSIWMPATAGHPGKKAVRAIYTGFSETPISTVAPLASLKTVQDHGTVEIMRGCPNGCRFCQAGYYYRPQRVKSYSVIKQEVDALVKGGGYREITLASLSSGDYPGIGRLLDALNAEYAASRVSFQLPSLKVSSFTLPIIRKLSEVRKSGLTFAIETPVDEWQLVINKDVAFDKTLAILREARAAGFKQAKFYFMIGLPVPDRGPGEVKAIVEFFERLSSCIQMQLNVNVGTFVPKPHTPFQWSAQLSEEEAVQSIQLLRSEFRKFRNIKLSYHSIFVSLLEGVISRGDERVGDLILAAWKQGARLDAWDEHFKREIWESVFSKADWPVLAESCRERNREASLPWSDINLRVSQATFSKELQRSEKPEMTSICMNNCTEPCGSCNTQLKVEDFSIHPESIPEASPIPLPGRQKVLGRMVFQYQKLGPAAFFAHLAVVEAFERAFIIAGIPIAFSEGFNPMPRLETLQPLPIALESMAEIASILMLDACDSDQFISKVNENLPKGLLIERAAFYPITEGKKQRTIGSLEWGSSYDLSVPAFHRDSLVQVLESLCEERGLASSRIESSGEAGIRIRLRLPKNKDHGLLRLLEAASSRLPDLALPKEVFQIAYKIRRTSAWAAQNLESEEPGDFFSSYQGLEN